MKLMNFIRFIIIVWPYMHLCFKDFVLRLHVYIIKKNCTRFEIIKKPLRNQQKISAYNCATVLLYPHKLGKTATFFEFVHPCRVLYFVVCNV